MLNKVTLIGNVGSEPTVRVMQSGGKVANISLATSESWKDKNGERQESTEWHKVVVYGDKLIDVIEKYVKKGSKLYVEGAIKSGKYTDSTGVERKTYEIVIQGFGSTIKILDSRNDSSGGSFSKSEDSDRIDSGSSNSKSNDRIDSSVSIDDDIPF